MKGKELFPEDRYESVRALVDTLFEQDPLSVTEIEGIELVQRNEERPDDEDCFRYTFGESDEETIHDLIEGGHRSIPVPDSVAFYFHDGILAHVGRVAEDGKIISKWGEGPVFKHRPHLVPTYYGRIEGYKIYPETQVA